jgi:ribosomal protein S18 acetylase RimI-like enzyme
MKIRKYRSSDHDALITLWATVFPDDPPHNEPSAVLAAKLEIDDLVFIAETNDRLIGACMAGYDGHRGWLYAVAVLPEHRRDGTGASLVETTVEALKSKGCIKVNLQIRAGNEAVMSFYKSLGFSMEERISMGRHIE